MLRQLPQDIVFIIILTLVILASGGDLISDLSQGVKTAHLIQESIILLLAITALVWLALGIRQQNRQIASLHQQLEEARDLPRPDTPQIVDARKRLADVIADQFVEWELTKSEKEVGQFLLKGLSLKEISVLRGTAEKTIRQQASSIYQKAGVSGRHAFSAWFIEDFL